MRVSNIVTLSVILVYSVSGQDTVHVKNGWNIIGSVRAGAIPDVLSTIPDSLITSAYWGYTPGIGYKSTDTLETGLGYWVKVNADGLIVFNNVVSVDSCRSKAFIYQGKFYHTVLIGNQCWMAENLDVGVMIPGRTGEIIPGRNDQTDNDTIEKYCYNDDPMSCDLFGGFYQWNEAMQYSNVPGTQGICPLGWHLPNIAEFDEMILSVGENGNVLKAIGEGEGAGAGTNTSGFSGLLAGHTTIDGYFDFLNYSALYWSSSQFDLLHSYSLAFSHNDATIYRPDNALIFGFSVRCIED